MEFNVSSAELLKALVDVSKAIPQKTTLTILENFHFSLKGTELEITASDQELTLRTKVGVEGVQDGCMAVPARQMIDLFKTLPDQPVNIHIRTWNDDENLYFSIQDDGQGIKKENVKKVFDKFYRVHTGNVHDVKGFGLGLAYVKEIINPHEGEIKCESELGKGTKFTITLPILREDSE